MIDTVIFDMVNVLISWIPEAFVARLGYGPEESALLRREVLGGMEWCAMDCGTMPQEEGWKRICRRLPASLPEAARQIVFDWWKPPLSPIPGMARLIADLKAEGYRILLLSNATSTLHEYFHRIPGSEYFDGLMVSADEKLLKPQHEIFEALFQRFSLVPENCCFIDDSPLNIEGAWEVGLPGIVFFGDMDRLRRELRDLGVRA